MINPRYGHAGFIAKTGLANSSVKYIVGFGKNKMGANSYSETLEYWSILKYFNNINILMLNLVY